jgi:hypothetical protein
LSQIHPFIPQDEVLRVEYEQGWRVTEIMPVHSSCMNTARDSLVIDVNKSQLVERIQMIADTTTNTDQVAEALGIQSTGWWSFNSALKKLKETPSWQNLIIECLYRPFDQRWLFYHHVER